MDQLCVDVQDDALHGATARDPPWVDSPGRCSRVRGPPRSISHTFSSSCLSASSSGPRVGECLGVDVLAAEVPSDPIAQARDDEVCQPPGNRGHRRRHRPPGRGTRKSIAHSPEPADIGAADVPRGRMLQQPRTGSQKVLLIGKTVQPRPQVLAPVPVQLIREAARFLSFPAHYRQRKPDCDTRGRRRPTVSRESLPLRSRPGEGWL